MRKDALFNFNLKFQTYFSFYNAFSKTTNKNHCFMKTPNFANKSGLSSKLLGNQNSVAGSAIQFSGMVLFEDDLKAGALEVSALPM